MNILFLLIPVSLVLGGVSLLGFLWTLKSDQYEDLEGAAHRILNDMPPPDAEENAKTKRES